MIDVIRQKFKEGMSVVDRENLTREFLQVLCLKIMHDRGAMEQMAFLGGTSLRILFDLRRFSEDLDFSLTGAEGYDFDGMIKELLGALRLYGFRVEARMRTHGAVQGTMVRFDGLLHELGLSPLPAQKFSIKIEVDTRPPAGWQLSRTMVNKTFLFPVTHYDLPSLFAGKLHACLFRTYTKGRDIYDLAWYLGRKVQPNYAQLNNAIRQTQGEHIQLDAANMKEFLLARIASVDLDLARRDVERFLEDKSELALFDRGVLSDAVQGAL